MNNNGSPAGKLKRRYFVMGIGVMCGVVMMSAACRQENEPPFPKVEKMEFQAPGMILDIDEIASVKLGVTPSEAKKGSKVTYTVSTEGIIAISDESNDGCVIKGLSGGSVVMLAKADGVTAYLEVTVNGHPFNAYPYIVIPTQVIELREGERKSLQVSLFNGSPTDSSGFVWGVEEGKGNISIQSTANTVVVEGMARGAQKVIVTHEKAEYAGEILVFVIGVEEAPRYITTQDNVILMEAGGVNRQFNVQLVNGVDTDKSFFSFNVVEGEGIVNFVSANETCSVTALQNGSAVIRAAHPLAEYPLDVRIIAMSGREPVIEIDKTFLLLETGGSDTVTMQIDGSAPAIWDNDYRYALSDENIVNVTKLNNTLFIEAVKPGSSVIEISNKNIKYKREVLVVVQSGRMVPPDEYYITTSQNIMQLEMGQSMPSQLMMQLINGNEADKDGFEWIVEDSAVIAVDPVHGTSRSARRMRSQITSVFNAVALVTPKKTGQSKITVIHPKTNITATVIARVYPRGTFVGLPITLGLLRPEGGLIKVDTTQENVTVELHTVTGEAANAGLLNWEIENENIAGVSHGNAFINTIHGKANGTTKLLVDGENLRYPYEGLVLAGTPAYIASQTIIYADNVYHEVAAAQSVSVEIKDSNDSLSGDFGFTVTVDRPDALYACMIRNRLLLQGLAETDGRIAVTVRNERSSNKTLTLYVTVLPESVTIDKPYVINGPNFVGMLINQEIRTEITMPNAAEVELDKTVWKVDDDSVLTAVGEGKTALVRAGSKKGQTNIRVTNPRAYNEKVIVHYVVENEGDLSKVVLGIEKEHYLMRPGDFFIARLITNADSDQKKNIRWGGYDVSVVRVDPNGDSAMIRAEGPGTTVITVDLIDPAENKSIAVLPLKIYISVSAYDYSDKNISLPSIVEILVNESRQIKADTSGLSADELRRISWATDSSAIVSISGEGEWAYAVGRGKGWTYATVKLEEIHFEKRILLVCAETYDDLLGMLVMAAPETYYRLRVGEQRTIQLLYGSAGFPEAMKRDIVWSLGDSSGAAAIFPNIDKVTFEARAVGKTTVRAAHRTLTGVPPVTITVEVYNDNLPNDYRWNYPAMVGISLERPEKPVSVTIVPAGASYGIAGYRVEPEGVVDVEKLGNGYEYRLTARSIGQAYWTLDHDLVPDTARILLYTAATEAELAGMWPVTLTKTNYLIGIGETVRIKAHTPTDDAAKTANLGWSLDVTGVVDYRVMSPKNEIEITGLKAGSCVIDLKYNNITQQKAYVSVSQAASTADANVKITTESIIGLVSGGEGRPTAVASNLSADEKKALRWTSVNSNIAAVVADTNDFSKAVITPVSIGETEVIVTYGQLTRHIKVYVQADTNAVNAYKAVNLDNRYYLLRRNNEMTLAAYHAASKADSADIWEDVYGNGVVSIEPLGENRAQVRGLNEGIATIKLRNTECATDVVFMVEVSNTAPGVEETPDIWYLSAGRTLYALDHELTTVKTQMEVIPMRFDEPEIKNIRWRVISGAHLVTLVPNGKYCDVMPNGSRGQAVVRAEHDRSSNYVDLTVICGLDLAPEDSNIPFMTADDNTVRMAINTRREVRMTLHNAPGADLAGFKCSVDNNNVTAGMTGDMLVIESKSSGQSLITVRHEGSKARQQNIIVVVTTTEDGIVYLTTRDNFTIVQQGDYKALNVELVGMTETNQANFTWREIKEGYTEDRVLISQSGSSAVVTGLRIGTAKIEVSNGTWCDYPLYLYIRVTQAIPVNPVYITTGNNIVSVRRNNSMQVKVELQNGGAHEMSSFVWRADNGSVAELTYSGDTALIKGLTAGSTGITVSHPSSMNTLTIMVIVEPELAENGIYITTDNLLVEMRQMDAPQQVRVRLIGGTAEDIYGFRWEVIDFVSIEKLPTGESRQVINIVGNADMCVVSAVREGYALIRVSHPKTSYRLEMRVVVQNTANISFGRNNIRMNVRSSEQILMSAPTGETVVYYSSNEKVATVTGTSKLCIIEGLSAGTAIITAQNPGGTKSDEIIVIVNSVDNQLLEYIEVTPSSLMLLTVGQQGDIPVQAALRLASNPGEDQPDGDYIKWTVLHPDVVKVTGNGRMVSFLPLGEGETEINLTLERPSHITEQSWKDKHPSMLNYTKKIYVRVDEQDISFVVNNGEQYITLVLGDGPKDFYATVGLPDINYSTYPVSWVSKKPEIVAVNLIGDKQLNKSVATFVPMGISVDTAVEVHCTFQGITKILYVTVCPANSVTINPSTVTVLPDQMVEVGIEIYPPNDTWTARLSTNSFIEAWTDSDNIKGSTQGGGDTGRNKLKIKGRNVEGVTDIDITATGSKVKALLVVNTNKNFYIRFLDRAMIRENLKSKGSLLGSAVSGWSAVSYEVSNNNEIEVIESSRPPHVNVHIDHSGKKIYFGAKSAGGGDVEFRDKVTGVTASIPVYFYHDLIEPKWKSARVGRGYQALNNGYGDAMPLHSSVDPITGAILIADGEYLEVTVDKPAINSNFPGNDFRILQHTASFFDEMNEDLRGKISVRMGTAYNGENTVQVEFNNGRRYGGAPSELLLSTEFVGTLKVGYAYSNGSARPAQFERVFLIYAQKYKRKD